MCSIFAGNGQKKAHCKEYDWQVPQSKMLETSRPNWTDNQKLDLPTRPACNHQIGVYSYVLAMDERKSARGLYDGLCLRGVAASVDNTRRQAASISVYCTVVCRKICPLSYDYAA